MRFSIEIDDKLASKLEPILLDRDLRLDEVVGLYLRLLVSSSQRSRPLGVDDIMPIGKFRDEKMSVVIRADPDYVRWMVAQNERFKLAPDAMALLESTLKP